MYITNDDQMLFPLKKPSNSQIAKNFSKKTIEKNPKKGNRYGKRTQFFKIGFDELASLAYSTRTIIYCQRTIRQDIGPTPPTAPVPIFIQPHQQLGQNL